MIDDSLALSIIVPVINEAERLPKLIADLRAQEDVDYELVVVDAGSTDDSIQIARDAGARVVASAPGRGRQMNHGTACAHHPTLLFLHADSALPDAGLLAAALQSWTARCQQRACHRVAGHFRLEFACHDGQCGMIYDFLEAKTALNRPYTFNGDQGLLIHRDFFEELGGFHESLPFLEDQRIGLEIYQRGHWLTLPGRLVTSARRFEKEGFGARYALMAIIMGAFVANVDEFFEALPDIYQTQSETGALELDTFLRGLLTLLVEMGPTRNLEAWIDVGRFVRANAWQLALMADVFVGSHSRALSFFDKYMEEKLDHSAVDALAAGLTFAVVLGVLPVAWRTRELRTCLSTRVQA